MNYWECGPWLASASPGAGSARSPEVVVWQGGTCRGSVTSDSDLVSVIWFLKDRLLGPGVRDGPVGPVHWELVPLPRVSHVPFHPTTLRISCPDVVRGPGGPWGWGSKVIYVSDLESLFALRTCRVYFPPECWFNVPDFRLLDSCVLSLEIFSYFVGFHF